MKRIIISLVLVILTSVTFPQYKMTIKNVDNTTDEIWIHDIIEITFTDVPFTCGTSTITYGGTTYNTVQIGTQCWFKENLNVGTKINPNSNQTDNQIIEKYCYGDNEANCTAYGGYYQWNEAMQYVATLGARGICPRGWHIPTQAEYTTLQTYVSDDGNALKAVGQGDGTNTSGFSALLAGFNYPGSGFSNFNANAYFWFSENGFTTYKNGFLISGGTTIGLQFSNVAAGFSIRCLKD